MKHIGIDCRFAGLATGLGRYTRELTLHLLGYRDAVSYVLLVRSRREPWLEALSGSADIREVPMGHYTLTEQTSLPSLLRSAKLDLFFAPHFNVPYFCPMPFVVTIHDLILHHCPNQAPLFRRAAYRLLMHRALRRARHVIAVSDFTASQIAELYGMGMWMKMTVTHEGIADLFRPPSDADMRRVRRAHALNRPYFLYMGNAKEHKNVQMLIDAFASLHSPDRELLLVTDGPETVRLRLAPGVRMLRRVAEADLPALYGAASAFVTASLYEGFCLPVAEAQACGCPVIATNAGAIPEVAAPGGSLLVPPTLSALADAMQRAHALSRKPYRRWNWEEVAAQTAEVLGRALHD